MTTVVVAGALANKHREGGSIWVRMSWVEALAAVGFDVLFLEQIAAERCVDATGRPAPFELSANAATFEAATATFGLAGRAALVCADDGRMIGMDRDDLLARLEQAAMLVNIGGHLRWRPALERLRHRIYVDLDPGFTQIWQALGNDAAGVDGHELHFTIGANVGTPACSLPTNGVRWRPIRQPVILERWPPTTASRCSSFTTYGLKAHQLRRFAELPRMTGVPFAIALDIHPEDSADADRLRAGGWQLRDSAIVGDVAGFRRFVQGSGAEFSAAQGIYVETRSGWLSDRTVRYLASGKPALVQDTGFSHQLPVGTGLVPFTDLHSAHHGALAIADDYERHCTAARAIAEQWFAPASALGPLLEATGVAP
jgi:hypothetical protein